MCAFAKESLACALMDRDMMNKILLLLPYVSLLWVKRLVCILKYDQWRYFPLLSELLHVLYPKVPGYGIRRSKDVPSLLRRKNKLALKLSIGALDVPSKFHR